MSAAGLILAAALVAQTPTASTPLDDPRCGGFCLYVALQSLDLAPASYAELERGLGRPSPGGYSMRQLEDYARGRGATTLAVETSLDNLKARQRPFACIALINPNHFLLISEIDDRVVHLVDPPREGGTPLDTFNATWSRKTLLLGRTPFAAEATIAPGGPRFGWLGWLGAAGLGLLLVVVVARRRRRVAAVACLLGLGVIHPGCAPAPTEPTRSTATLVGETRAPHLVFQPEHHDLGTITSTTVTPTRVVRTLIENRGDRPVTILEVTPSCLCTTLSLPTPTINPHASAELTLSVRLGDSPEPRRTTIQVKSDDPLRPNVPITVAWQVRPALATEPRVLSWMDLRPGDRRQTSLAIYATDLILCDRCELVALTNTDAVAHHVQRQPTTNHDHERPDPSPGDRRWIGDLHVELRCPFEAGLRQTSLDLLLKCHDEVRTRLAIPLSWEVTPALQVLPSRLSLGAQPANAMASGQVVVRSPRGSPFLIRQVHDPADRVQPSVSLSPTAQATHGFAVEIRTPTTPGPWATTLTIETDLPGSESLILPVSGYTPEP